MSKGALRWCMCHLPSKDTCSECISDQVSPAHASVADTLRLIGGGIMIAA